VLGAIASARGHCHARAARRERSHQMAADEAGTADDEDVVVLQALRFGLRAALR
jgi:hypothetical protein